VKSACVGVLSIIEYGYCLQCGPYTCFLYLVLYGKFLSADMKNTDNYISSMALYRIK